VLDSGALAVLERKIRDWITAKSASR